MLPFCTCIYTVRAELLGTPIFCDTRSALCFLNCRYLTEYTTSGTMGTSGKPELVKMAELVVEAFSLLLSLFCANPSHSVFVVSSQLFSFALSCELLTNHLTVLQFLSNILHSFSYLGLSASSFTVSPFSAAVKSFLLTYI